MINSAEVTTTMRTNVQKIAFELAVTLIVLVALLLLWPATAHSQVIGEPDAALVGQTLTGETRTVTAASWIVARPSWLEHRRAWLDLFEPQELAGGHYDRLGLGASVDVTAGSPYCVGGGWRPDAWFGYAGYHVGW